MTARCPAKVNLGLAVLGRRPDGFHEIATIYQAIDIEDRLEAAEAPELSLTCDDPGVPADEGNLVLRAARALQDRYAAARPRGAALALHKAIPAGAGLGGGSSDAAGAIAALAALWELPLGSEDALAVASALGSDVPFFLRGGRALGTGRGEILTPLPEGPPRALVVGSPPFPLSTASVYRALSATLTPPEPAVTVTRFLVKLAEGNDFARAPNDLERAAFAMRPELAAFKSALLQRGAEMSLLCGSGSSVFGMFAGFEEAGETATRLARSFPDWTVRVTRTTGLGARLTA
ncbi:MAG TPA: 4-(cytidine 5'-diphospho)-2-C-methyl-D-erythritol kinase [Candidatus Polarisedimenticolaceae bacterium]|nr:4-(cytidine 5'-diphospho)-2-C-methyl-D-erythritol kinase [Candidatus Polarisedimenticolaceae bacterium]